MLACEVHLKSDQKLCLFEQIFSIFLLVHCKQRELKKSFYALWTHSLGANALSQLFLSHTRIHLDDSTLPCSLSFSLSPSRLFFFLHKGKTLIAKIVILFRRRLQILTLPTHIQAETCWERCILCSNWETALLFAYNRDFIFTPSHWKTNKSDVRAEIHSIGASDAVIADVEEDYSNRINLHGRAVFDFWNSLLAARREQMGECAHWFNYLNHLYTLE